MSSESISFHVDTAERRDIAARAERDKVSLSDYIRVRLGLRAEGSADGNGDGALNGDAGGDQQAQLADHERRLAALEAAARSAG